LLGHATARLATEGGFTRLAFGSFAMEGGSARLMSGSFDANDAPSEIPAAPS
jgi:hypothetical protein